MSDRVEMATPSYRPAPAGTGDPAMRRMAIAAAAIAGLGLVALAAASLLHRGPRAVPVIEAEAGPVRIKPDNPGGQKAMGAALVADGKGADALAPAPEEPHLDAFRQAFHPPHAKSAPAPAAAAPSAASPTAASPKVVASPSPRQAMAEPLTSEVARHAAGQAAIQLAAFGSESAARAEWDRLRARLPGLLGTRSPDIERAEHDGHTIWRLRTGGFSDTAEAVHFCERVRARGAACSIAF